MQLLPHRPGNGLPTVQSCLSGLRGEFALDPVNLRDALQCLGGYCAVHTLAQQLVKLAPRVRQAGGGEVLVLSADDAVVGLVFVAHQRATPAAALFPIAAEERNRVLSTSPNT